MLARSPYGWLKFTGKRAMSYNRVSCRAKLWKTLDERHQDRALQLRSSKILSRRPDSSFNAYGCNFLRQRRSRNASTW